MHIVLCNDGTTLSGAEEEGSGKGEEFESREEEEEECITSGHVCAG